MQPRYRYVTFWSVLYLPFSKICRVDDSIGRKDAAEVRVLVSDGYYVRRLRSLSLGNPFEEISSGFLLCWIVIARVRGIRFYLGDSMRNDAAKDSSQVLFLFIDGMMKYIYASNNNELKFDEILLTFVENISNNNGKKGIASIQHKCFQAHDSQVKNMHAILFERRPRQSCLELDTVLRRHRCHRSYALFLGFPVVIIDVVQCFTVRALTRG